MTAQTVAAQPVQSDITGIFRRQQEYKKILRRTDAATRIAKLRKLRAAIMDWRPRIYEALYNDFKKHPAEVDITEIMSTIAEISEAAAHLNDWMRPHTVGTPILLAGAKSEVRFEPKGCSLVIAPWNYPFHLAVAPIVSAIAAGNTVVLKPSEFTRHTSALLREFLAGLFADEEIAVIEGDHTVARDLLELPFDHVFFTGSPQVGKSVMAAAAKHLSSVTLELGGKSPVIVDDSANMLDSARKIAWGKFINAGQTCVAPDYVLVPETRREELLTDLKRAVSELYPNENYGDFARIVNKRHFDRLQGYLQGALKKSARIICGGETDAEDLFIAPTVITDVAGDSLLMTEEIFGPILPVIGYRRLEDAFDLVAAKTKPLALYIFSGEERATETILRETSAGGTAINDTIVHLANGKLPFGGVNTSGHGSYHGIYGFKAFSHERAVLRQFKFFSTVQMMYPPYSKTKRDIIETAMRYFL